MIKVALVSRHFGNIGHSFMALGAKEILLRAAGKRNVTFFEIDEHRAFDSKNSSGSPRYVLNPTLTQSATDGFPFRPESTHFSSGPGREDFRNIDLAVTAGGPYVVKGGHKSKSLKRHLVTLRDRLSNDRKVPIVDLGIGSRMSLDDPDWHITNREDRLLYSKFAEISSALFTRDKTTTEVFADLGFSAQHVHCASLASGFWFKKEFNRGAKVGDYILINYQQYGTNVGPEFSLSVDPLNYFRLLRKVVNDLSRSHNILFLAHSREEVTRAKTISPDIQVAYPRNVKEYAAILQGAKVGLVSRIHAAHALASVGVPSVVFGADSRLQTIEELGLPTLHSHSPIQPRQVVGLVEQLLDNKRKESDRLLTIREKTLTQYAGEVANWV